MLTYLHVKNIALIDELEVDFNEGLNILTGETGAGKSIIIGSINAALGSKISKDFLRSGSEDALIEILFQINSQILIDKIKDFGIDIKDGELLISRKMIQNGRSVFRVNGQVANTNMVKKISESIIDIHSQHEHQSLLNKKNHIKLLDSFLGENLEKDLNIYRSKYKEYLKIKQEIIDDQDPELRKRELSFLEFEINEIESANLTINEDKELNKKYKLLSNSQKIRSVLNEIYNNIIDDNAYNISHNIREAIKDINTIRKLDSDLENLSEQLEQIDLLISDFSRDLNLYVNNIDINEEELEVVHNRLDLINSLKMKYGDTIDDILDLLESKINKHEKLINYEKNVLKIQESITKYEEELMYISNKISDIRNKGAKELSSQIIDVLKDLNLKDTNFEVNINKKHNFDVDGIDDVEFLISTNKGEPTKPLIQIASGGELSRIMLAIKSVLANCDEISTLIFDEIDSGISGRTAQMVAQKLEKLSKNRQILCITHLPQIASMSDTHYVIEKVNKSKQTVTRMKKLNNDEIPNELARLIGGAEITDTVIKSAIEMRSLAKEIKLI